MIPTSTSDAVITEAVLPVRATLPEATVPGPAQVIRNHRAILESTAEIFPGAKIDVEEAVDPEIEGDPYLVIMVTTSGEVPEIVARHREWHFRIWEVAPQTAHAYRLCLDVR